MMDSCLSYMSQVASEVKEACSEAKYFPNTREDPVPFQIAHLPSPPVPKMAVVNEDCLKIATEWNLSNVLKGSDQELQ